MYALILAGGEGRRLQQFTRRFTHGKAIPKQYCSFGTDRSPLQRTLGRIDGVVPASRAVVIVGVGWRALAMRQVAPFPGVEVVAQPCDRGTAVGILFGLAQVLARDPKADVVILPSDHGVRDDVEFRAQIARARGALGRGADVILLGAAASGPSPDFGWIVPGPDLGGDIFTVRGFVEKPCLARAESLFRAGACWNTMIAVARGSVLWRLIDTAAPAAATLLSVTAGVPEPERSARLAARYPSVPCRDFSRDVLEGAHGVAVAHMPDRVGWSDIGTPERIMRWLESEAPMGRRR